MTDMLFYLFAAVAVGASLLVIAQRNPIYSVLLLIASFGALSGLYVLLDAPFVAVIQIIVYAGAIMVLFLFVVMLLNAPQEDTEVRRAPSHPLLRQRADAVRRGCSPLALAAELVWALTRGRRVGRVRRRDRSTRSPPSAGRCSPTTRSPFEVTSVLILVAMVGAVRAGAPREPAASQATVDADAQPLPAAVGDAVRHRHGRRVPPAQPDHDPAVDRDHAERGEPDVRRVRPRARHRPTARSSCSSS